MKFLWLLLISAVCLTLLVPADAWGRRRWGRWRSRRILRRVGRAVGRYIIRRATYGLLRRNCETKYALGCTADDERSEGLGSCQLTTIGCSKRELSEEEYLRDMSVFNVPFSKDIDDYDDDGDGYIDKEEFIAFVESAIAPMKLKDPAAILVSFDAADLDDDGLISNDELELSQLFFGDDDGDNDGDVGDDNNDDDNV